MAKLLGKFMKDYNTDTCWFCKKPFSQIDVGNLAISNMERSQCKIYDNDYFTDRCYNHNYTILFDRAILDNNKFQVMISNHEERLIWYSNRLSELKYVYLTSNPHNKKPKCYWKDKYFNYSFDKAISNTLESILEEIHTLILFS